MKGEEEERIRQKEKVNNDSQKKTIAYINDFKTERNFRGILENCTVITPKW